MTTGPISELQNFMLFGSGGGIALGCLLMLGIPARKRHWRSMLGVLLLFAVAGLGFGLMGCGGGGSSGGTTVTVGSSGSGSSSNNGPNVTVPVKVTITGNGSIAPGSYPVVVTGDAQATSQIHTITITTAVQ